jgi:serine/threonine protein kinase
MIRALTITRGGKLVARVSLPPTGVLTIGRDATSDLVLASAYVSRRHAELRLTDNAWVVIDTSANGLQVRGLSVGRSQPFVLSAGDHIVIGDYELLCESDDDERSNSDTPEPLVANRAADLISPDGEMRFQTNRGTTILTAPMPFAYGRTSVLFRGQGDSSDLCVKLFPNVATEELRSFNAETRVQMALTHPNILKVLDVGVQTMSAGGPFVVLPFCAGGSFRDLLHERSFYSVEAIMPLLAQLAAAIDYAHRAGVIHGDIKPENALLSNDRKQAFLSDFGMAKAFALKESFSTQPIAAGGTTAYLSPEQITGNEQTPLSDVYSFAITAYELLTGQLPFARTLPPFQQMTQKVTGSVADPLRFNPMMSDRARAGLLSGLATDPLKRPRSATALCQILAGTSPSVGSTRSDAAQGRRSVFVSYSHKDKKWLERITNHLRPLERDGQVLVFDDRQIEAGRDWRTEIATALRDCSCAVLLISANFLASDFCIRDELPVLLDAAATRGLSIFPVVLSPCHLTGTPLLAALQTVNPPSRTLIELDRGEQERVLANLAKSIEELT